MQDAKSVFDTSLAELPNGEWLKKISEISEEHGHFQALGKRHFAARAPRSGTGRVLLSGGCWR